MPAKAVTTKNKYQHAIIDLADAIEKELRIIRERHGMRCCREAARDLIEAIETNVECQAIILKETRRAEC